MGSKKMTKVSCFEGFVLRMGVRGEVPNHCLEIWPCAGP